jgi:transcriptional regulator with XRE-family HTH domain
MTRKQVADAILRFRQGSDWTQDELARRVGVTSATVSRWEAEISIPSHEYVARLHEMGLHLSNVERIAERERIADSLSAGDQVILHGPFRVTLRADGALLIEGRDA